LRVENNNNTYEVLDDLHPGRISSY